jgi:lipopolysaccharide/colanic/teichoic acid biosynthesis glycosyltransferase
MSQPFPDHRPAGRPGRLGAFQGPVQLQLHRRSPGVERLDRVAKRAMDVLLANCMLLAFSPLMLVIALMIRLTSPGPVLFRQVRVGYWQSPFVMLKFRTMHQGIDDVIHRSYVTAMLNGQAAPADAERGIYKLTRDPRVTSIGRFLRKTSLDELPQLINVLRGEMSLVGPRPVLPWEAKLFKPWDRVRFAVRPGITGLWQVTGRNALTMQEALHLDVEYALRRTIVLDLIILFRTIPSVLLKRGAS